MIAYTAKRVVTCDPERSTQDNPLGVIENGAVVVDGSTITWVGSAEQALAFFPDVPIHSHPSNVLTPGLVDAHTHAAWTGSRDNEYALRMAGADYETIAKAGGGIVSSMRAVRAASLSDLTTELSARVERMAMLGVTTVEVKSGYGLNLENETKQLLAVKAASEHTTFHPHLVPTYLGLHALPPEAAGDRDGYTRQVTTEFLPSIAKAGLAHYVDAYVDRNAFTADQARRFFEKALDKGLSVRVHAGQFADVGGAELAADLSAVSADHLENVGPNGIERMAGAGVRAVLLPTASFTLGQTPPPVAAFRNAGVNMVVASDANPGTAPTESLPLAMALAVRLYGLTVPEVILGATREAAASLGLARTAGVLKEGYRADLVVWDLPHENAIIQPWGTVKTLATVIAGRSSTSPAKRS